MKYKEEVTKICPECGNEFNTVWSTKTYCSSICQDRHHKAYMAAWHIEHKEELKEKNKTKVRKLTVKQKRKAFEKDIKQANNAGMTYGQYMSMKRCANGSD